MNKPQIILGIESSCDETAAAVVQKSGDRVQILSNVVASSAALQAKYGGVVPEQAAREQLKSIIPVIQESLQVAGYRGQEIDAIAITQGPGLIGSLLVGVETAKTLSTVWQKPLVPVNHLLGHFYANWISDPSSSLRATAKQSSSDKNPAKVASSSTSPRNDKFVTPTFPLIGLLISGGHTDLVLMTGHGKYEYLGGTRDDAAGECFDKCARALGLPYPGGPVISKLAEQGNPKAFNLPRPMIDSKDLDFSFSGLKTAVANLIENRGVVRQLADQDPEIIDICASLQESIADVLVKKTVQATQIHKVEQIILAGGVAANQRVAKKILTAAKSKLGDVRVFIPSLSLCTDNAAYIATAAFYNYHPVDPLTLQAQPNLSLS